MMEPSGAKTMVIIHFWGIAVYLNMLMNNVRMGWKDINNVRLIMTEHVMKKMESMSVSAETDGF